MSNEIPPYVPPPAPAPTADGDLTQPPPDPAVDPTDPLAAPPVPTPWLDVYAGPTAMLMLMGVTPGVPGIDAPPIGCAPEDMMAVIGSMVVRTQEAQLNVSREGLKISQKKQEELQAKAMDRIETWIEKTKEAEKNAEASGVLGWVKRIAMPTAMVGMSLLAFAAGPAAGMVALTMTSYMLAQQYSGEAGGPNLSLADGLVDGITKMLMAGGMSKEDAEGARATIAVSVGAAAVGAMMIVSPTSGLRMAVWGAAAGSIALDPKLMGNAAGGAAELSGASEEDVQITQVAVTAGTQIAVSIAMMGASAAAASRMASAGAKGGSATAAKLMQAGTVAVSLLGVANGAASVADGVLARETADLQRKADMAGVDKRLQDVALLRQQAQMDQQFEELRKAAERLDSTWEIVSGVAADADQNRAQIAAHAGGNTI